MEQLISVAPCGSAPCCRSGEQRPAVLPFAAIHNYRSLRARRTPRAGPRARGPLQQFRLLRRPPHQGMHRPRCCASRAHKDDLQFAISEAERARHELEELMVEQQEAQTAAKKNASKAERFVGTLKLLEAEALKHVQRDDTQAARRALQQRDIVLRAAEKAKARANVNKRLAEKLTSIIGSKEVEVVSLLSLARRVAGREKEAGGGGSGSKAGTQEESKKVDIEEAFLELERSSLESLLSIAVEDTNEPGSQSTEESNGLRGTTAGRAPSQECAAEMPAEEAGGSGEEEPANKDNPYVWWTLGLAAMQDGETLPCPGPQAESLAGGARSEGVKTEASALIRKMVNSRMQGKEVQGCDLAHLVVLSLLPAEQQQQQEEATEGEPVEDNGSFVHPQGSSDGRSHVETVALVAAERPGTVRMSLFRAGADTAVEAALSGAPAQSCRGFVVALSTIMGIQESTATELVADLVLQAVRRRLLSAAVELRQVGGAASGAVEELLRGASSTLAAFPPLLDDKLSSMAADIQSFTAAHDRAAMLDMWKRSTEADPQAAELGERILGQHHGS
mmetsp:Transcript_17918/g.50147  ORF Transcript_17918/g.50147 Transcript_17918/m.50147 type:complete len:563 (+) Transcript_17918:99-1787(+)